MKLPDELRSHGITHVLNIGKVKSIPLDKQDLFIYKEFELGDTKDDGERFCFLLNEILGYMHEEIGRAHV